MRPIASSITAMRSPRASALSRPARSSAASIGTEHRENGLALGGDALARLVDGARGAIEHGIDFDRHLAGDLFEPAAGGLAGRFHTGDMRGEALGGAAGDLVGLAAALGKRRELGIERRGALAGEQPGAVDRDARPCTPSCALGKRGEDDLDALLGLGPSPRRRCGCSPSIGRACLAHQRRRRPRPARRRVRRGWRAMVVMFGKRGALLGDAGGDHLHRRDRATASARIARALAPKRRASARLVRRASMIEDADQRRRHAQAPRSAGRARQAPARAADYPGEPQATATCAWPWANPAEAARGSAASSSKSIFERRQRRHVGEDEFPVAVGRSMATCAVFPVMTELYHASTFRQTGCDQRATKN